LTLRRAATRERWCRCQRKVGTFIRKKKIDVERKRPILGINNKRHRRRALKEKQKKEGCCV